MRIDLEAAAVEPEAAGEQERVQRGLALAYRYLNRRERTVAEMRGHLSGRGIDRDTANAVVGLLSGDGYLDDHRYARLLVEDKRALEAWGDERIRRALRARGIDRETVEEALLVSDAASQLERALELLKRRVPTPPTDRRERERAFAILLRKGYDSDLALEALARYAGPDADPEPD